MRPALVLSVHALAELDENGKRVLFVLAVLDRDKAVHVP